jgi:L-amino acid N-acyltransferase YncA
MIRNASPADVPAILDIYNESVLHSTATFDITPQTLEERQQWLAEHTPEQYPAICLVIDDVIVGWGSLSPYRTRPAYRFSVEYSVYIHKDHQGRGYGRILLEELLARAQQLGYRTVIGCMESSNTASLDLSYKLGFVKTGELHQVGYKFDRWLDVTFVEKILDSAQ